MSDALCLSVAASSRGNAGEANAPTVVTRVDPRRDGAWHGVLTVDLLPRLEALGGSGNVTVDLLLATDQRGRVRVTGHCRYVANICCSRCLRLDAVPTVCDIDLRIVATEAEARALMPLADSLVSTDERIDVAELIEDDLVMSIPEIACEDRDSCIHARFADPQGDSQDGASQHPFAALAALKR